MRLFHYKVAEHQYIRYNRKTSYISYGSNWEMGRETWGRMAYVTENYSESPYSEIRFSVRQPLHRSPAPGATVFVSSGSKIPRDLLRNSGYKITRDKDKADGIIIPLPENQRANKCFICGMRNSDAFTLFHIVDSVNGERFVPELIELNNIINSIKNRFGTTDITCSEKGFNVYFTKDNPEHEAILNNQQGKYYFDVDVKLTPSTNITPENLKIISNLPDDQTKFKVLMGSDFQKYPYTICMFLRNDMFADYGHKYGESVNWFMRTIGYDEFDENDYKKLITPEDFDMLQSWILYQIGMTDTGLVSTDRVNNDLTSGYREMLTYKLAVKKTGIDHPMDLTNLKAHIANSR